MADQIISTDLVDDIILIANDDYILLPGVTHTTASTFLSPVKIDSSVAVEMIVLGTIFSFSSRAIDATAASDNLSIYVGATGSIIAREGAFMIDSSGADFRLNNYGSISGGQIEIDGDDARIINYGTISGTYADFSDIAAIDVLGDNAFLNNGGTIASISSDVILATEDLRIINSGTISGANDAIRGTLSSVETLRVTNSGMISADEDAISMLFGTAVINNTGTIIGNLVLGSGDDAVFNAGSIIGDIGLGSGDDTYRALGEGLASTAIDGDFGNDTIIGADGDDEFYGGFDDDILRGKGGEDVLTGGEGDDILDGGYDNDVLRGEDDADKLFGKFGNDTLFGGAGDDLLQGDEGDDILYGDGGTDRLFGGTGNDTFVFSAITDSPDTAARDLIRDFEQGADLISIGQLAGPAISFIGSSAFTGTTAEVRVVANAAGDSNVYIDTDGNGVADMRILVSDITTLTVDDFVL